MKDFPYVCRKLLRLVWNSGSLTTLVIVITALAIHNSSSINCRLGIVLPSLSGNWNKGRTFRALGAAVRLQDASEALRGRPAAARTRGSRVDRWGGSDAIRRAFSRARSQA